LELWLERSLWFSAIANFNLVVTGSWVFFLFASQTKGFRLAEAIRYGKAGYVATGRGYVIEPGSFIGLYCVYAKSHMYTGFEVMCLLTMYHIYTPHAMASAVWPLWFYAASMMLAPYLFNPQSLSINTISSSFGELRAWFADGLSDKTNKDHHGSWVAWHANRLKPARGQTIWAKAFDHGRIALLRLVLLLPTAARLEPAADSLPSHRVLLLLVAGAAMCAVHAVVCVLASETGVCSRCLLGLDGASRSLVTLYRTAVVAAAVSVASFVVVDACAPYCDLSWSSSGRTNALLLLFAALLQSTFVLQLLVTLRPPRPADAENAIVRIGYACKSAFISLADYWYYVMDLVVSGTIICTLSILAMLPLLSLQSAALFNRDFAKVIATKLRRAELLKRILS